MLADVRRRAWALERPEHRLLLSCAHADLGSDVKDQVTELLRGQTDWSYVLATAQEHGVMPILYRSLTTLGNGMMPPDFRETLHMRYLANASRNLLFVRALLDIVSDLESHGIPSVPLKGPALAVSAYGNLSLRQFSDLDILVHRRDAMNAKKLLNSMGYVNNFGLPIEAEAALMRYQKDFQLISPVHKTIVELHWALEPGRQFRRFSDESVWKRLSVVHLEGKDLPNLSPEDSVLYLSLHGANHRWDRLCWINDLARTIGQHPDLDWELIREEAGRLQSRRALFLGLTLAQAFLSAPVPQELAETAVRYPGVRAIAELVADRLFHEPGHVSNLRRSFSFHLMVSESLRHKLRLCARRILLPDAVDFRSSTLPSRFYFLLPLLRPIRLLKENLLGK